MTLAPVALFAYRRADHLRRTVQSLLDNPQAAETELTIYCDGPKDDAVAPRVAQVVAFAKNVTGFKSVTVVQRERNLGLAASIIDGAGAQLRGAGRVIVVEDDLILAPGFLGYMNRALDAFRDEPRVWQVSGYMFPIASPPGSCFLLPLSTSWGWATWERAWAGFRRDNAYLETLRKDAAMQRAFNLDGAYDYFSMLEMQAAGKVDSWAIYWQANVFFGKGLVLYPPRTLVKHDGSDDNATHGGPGFESIHDLFRGDPSKWPLPSAVAPDDEVFSAIKDFLRGRRPGLLQRIRRRLMS
jgi:hypothetical protein